MSHHLRRSKVSARPLSAVVVACLLAVFIAAPAGAVDAAPTFIAPGTSSWTVPAGVTSISIECWGGGGGGGTDSSNTSGGAGGGGGGAYAKVYSLTVTPGTVYTYTVGAAGSAAPTAGGNSSFNGLTCVAAGGAAGTSANNGNGGAGGTVLGSAGDIRFPGGAGAAGGNSNGGGGGSSAGPNTLSTIVPGTGITGTNGSGISGGTTVPGGGPGGSGGSGSNGNPPGSGPGGGGGGGEYASPPNGTRAGGAGYAGQVRIRYNATLSVDTPSVTYNGSSQSTTVSASVAGTVSNIKYNGSSTAPTAAGTYAITADFVPTDAANYNTFSGVTAGTFTINKAATTTTVTCTAGPFTYDGTAKTPCSATVTGPNNLNQTVAVTYVNNTNAGTATANANYAGGASYLASTGSTNFTIGKAATTTTVTCTAGPFSYDGTAKTPCSAAATGPGLNQSLTAVYTDNINAGTATASASYAPVDPTNYLPSSGSKTFTISKASTTTTVTCSGGPFTYTGSEITPSCTAAATGVGGLNQTGLTVSFANNINAGTATASATYAGTANYLASNGSTPFTIGKATPTIAIQNPSSVTYNGSAQAATVIGSVAGIPSNVQYSGSGTAPTNAGTYAITADFAPTDSTNYNTLSGASAGNFTINKATPTLSVTNSPVTFNGAPQDATLAAARGVATVLGSFTNVQYGGSGTAPTDAGTYAVTADFAPIDSTNYNSVTDGTAGSFVIDKATPTLSVTNSPVTFNGAPQDAALAAARGLAAVPGSFTNVQYGGSGAPPTDAGTYAVTADFAPTDAGNYNSLSGATAGSLTIGKAPSTTAVNCGAGSFTYTGAALTPCTAGVTGVGGFSQVLTVDYTDNTSAGTAGAAASFTGNTNFAASSDSTTFIIGKAASATTVTCTGGPFVYQNAPFTPCSATLTGAGGLTGSPTVSYSSNTDAGTASASASFAGDANHLGSSGSTTFAIDKATPVLAVSNPSVTYTGLAQAASVVGSAAVVGPVDGTASNVKYGVSSTAPADAGTYAITADFTPADTDNYNSVLAAAAGNFVIGKAASTTTVSCGAGPFTYTGSAITPCSSTLTGAGGLTGSPEVSYSSNIDVGTASASAGFAGDDNYLASSDSKTFAIAKAASATTVTCDPGPFVYKNAAFTPCAATLTGAGGLTGIPEVSYSSNVDAGTATASAGYAGDANHEASSGSKNFTIDKATPVLAVSNSPVTYNGAAQAATVTGSAAVIGSVTGAASSVKYGGSDTVPADAGTYAITADFTPADTGNYNSVTGAAAGDFVIEKAATATAVTCSGGPFVYQNAPYTPCSAIVTGPPNLNQALTVNYANNTAAGTASANASFGGSANYQPSSDSKNFTIDKATPTISVQNPSVTYNGVPQLAIVNGSVAGASNSIKYDGADTAPTDAGTYAVTADFAPTDTGNYISLSGAMAGSFTIAKANPTLSLNNPVVGYDGTAHAAEVIGSVDGTPSNVKYNGSDVVPSDAGTYAITADFAPANGTNHNSLVGASAGNFVIQKAGSPVLSVDNPSATYDGQPHPAVVVGSIPGTPSNVLYNGSATVPTDAGTYVITADYAPGDPNYNSVTGEAAGTLVIAKAATTTAVTCGAGPFTYTGTAFTPCAATVTGPGNLNGVVTVSYSNNVNAGTAAANADYAGSANYLPSSDGKTFPIAKADPGLTVHNSPVTYNGTAQTADVRGSVGGTVSNIRYNGSATAPINAGTYAITADFAPEDTGNYNTLNSGNGGNFVIQKAGTPVLTVNNPTVTFDGAPHAATIVGSVAGTPSNIKYNGSATVPVNAGTYIITADYTPTDTTNYDAVTGASAGSLTIAKAPTATTVTCESGPFTYTGAAITPCTAGVTGPGGLNQAVTVTYVGNVNAGTAAANAAYAGATNYQQSSGAATFTIDQAATTTTITCGTGPFTYTGSAIEPCAASATGPGGLNHTVAVGYADNTNSGTASASASFEGSTNYLPSSGAATFTIGRAATTTAVSCQAGPFTYNGTAFTPCAASVTGPGGLSQAAAVSYSGSTNAGTASASASFAGGANYLASSGAATFTIDKAATTTVITCDPGPFSVTGLPVEPCTARVTGPAGLDAQLAMSYSNNVNAGTATASASYAGAADYLPSSDSEVFVIGEAVESTVFLHLPYMSK